LFPSHGLASIAWYLHVLSAAKMKFKQEKDWSCKNALLVSEKSTTDHGIDITYDSFLY